MDKHYGATDPEAQLLEIEKAPPAKNRSLVVAIAAALARRPRGGHHLAGVRG